MNKLDRKNWIYPDEERLTSVIYSKQAIEYFNKLSKDTAGINIIEYFKFININKDEDTD